MKQYRVGIVGLGAIGKVHAYGYAALPYFSATPGIEARVTHVVAGHDDTAEAGRRLVGADVASTDHRDVTENPEIDIVHICTPNHRHLEPLLAAMRGQKHIYCEKPLVATWQEALQVRDALSDFRGVSQVVFHNRFFPATLRAKQLIDAGAIGEILEFRAAYLQASHANPALPMRWKASAAAGGGAIADIASHALDLCEHLVGPLAEVMAATHVGFATRRDPRDRDRNVPVDAEDCVAVLARLRHGPLGTIQATKLATGTENELLVEIYGTRGAIRYNGMDPHHLLFYDATQPEKPCGGTRGWIHIDCGHRYEPPHSTFPATKSNVGWLRGHVASLVNFLEAVQQNRPTQPDIDRGIAVEHLMECVRQSAQQRRWVEVEPQAF